MEARAVLPPQPRGEGKVKNEQGQRNRPVLGDIGNLDVVRIANPVIAVVDDKLAVNRKCSAKKATEAQEKATEKPKRETVAVITSIKEENVDPVSERKSREQSSRREVKTLTAILTARSKAACGVTFKPEGQVVNIDAGDENDVLAVVEYIDDIYKFYKLTEDESQVHDYMKSQPDINVKMRLILIDWLIEVHEKFKLTPETLFLTINIVDRYLSMKTIVRKELQLVGISSMLLACKYEESCCLQVHDLVCISENFYSRNNILEMEKSILEKLEWYFTIPTPYVFLARYIKASLPPNQEIENMVFFLAELGLTHYPTIILYRPSLIAAAAVYAARCTLGKTPFWSETLKHYSGYCEEQIMDCAKLLVGFHSVAAESKFKAVYKKYSNPDRGAVAHCTPPKSLLSTSL